MAAYQASSIRDIREFPADAGLPLFLPTIFSLLLLLMFFLFLRRSAVISPVACCCRNAASWENLRADYRAGELGEQQLFNRLAAFLQQRFHGSSGRLNSFEFLARISASGLLDPGALTEISAVMQLCDKVKFGRYLPAAAEVEDCLTRVEALLAVVGDRE